MNSLLEVFHLEIVSEGIGAVNPCLQTTGTANAAFRMLSTLINKLIAAISEKALIKVSFRQTGRVV